MLLFSSLVLLVQCTFVAIGCESSISCNASIKTSPDGFTWSSRLSSSLFPTQNVLGATYGSLVNVFVATGLGQDSLLASSDAGMSWSGMGTAMFQVAYSVTYGGGIFVAVGLGNNRIATSTDGLIWTGQGNLTFNQNGNDVAYDGIGRFVAVGGCCGVGSIATTVDPLNASAWDNTVGNNIFFTAGNGIAYGAGQWVAVGFGVSHTIANSADGKVWIGQGVSVFGPSSNAQGFKVAFGNGRFIAVGINTAGSTVLAFSLTGLSFNIFSTPAFTGFASGVSFTSGLWFLAGNNATLAYSVDGVSFVGEGSVFGYTGQNVVSDNRTLTIQGNTCGFLPRCSCAGSLCVVAGSAVSTATLNVASSSALLVQGNLTLGSSSVLVASVSTPSSLPLVVATSTIFVNGKLVVVVGKNVESVTILSAPLISGTFSVVSVTASDSSISLCSSSLMYSQSTLSVTVTVCGLSVGAVIGIAVSGVVGVSLIVIVLIILTNRALQKKAEKNVMALNLNQLSQPAR
jgi:hypothetical protein